MIYLGGETIAARLANSAAAIDCNCWFCCANPFRATPACGAAKRAQGTGSNLGVTCSFCTTGTYTASDRPFWAALKGRSSHPAECPAALRLNALQHLILQVPCRPNYAGARGKSHVFYFIF